MADDLASRLRALRDRQGWTVSDMAERTGIPKRTLDKYMLRSGANHPGFDALLSISKGLGVSLDWLVFGSDFVSEGSELLAAMAAEVTSQQYFELILRYHHSGERPVVDGEEILGLTPEDWASDMGSRVGAKAKELASRGITRQELLEWHTSSKERDVERLRNKIDRLSATVPS